MAFMAVFRRGLWIFLLALASFSLSAQEVRVKASAPDLYVVKTGDTLWDIAGLYLDKPWLWPYLWRDNTHIRNPHLIYPGDEIRLSYNAQGQPQLSLNQEQQPTKPAIRLRPQVKVNNKSQEQLRQLSWELLYAHVAGDVVVSESEYEALPYLLGDQEGAVRYSDSDVVLSQNVPGAKLTTMKVVRKQLLLKQADDSVLGVLLRHVADAQVLATDVGQQSLVQVLDSNFESQPGDRLLPINEDLALGMMTLQSAKQQRGHIVHSLQQYALLGKYDLVVIDLGAESVEVGTTFGIYQQGPDILQNLPPEYLSDTNQVIKFLEGDNLVKQPALKVGELIVFKVFSGVSFALISNATQVVKPGAIVASP